MGEAIDGEPASDEYDLRELGEPGACWQVLGAVNDVLDGVDRHVTARFDLNDALHTQYALAMRMQQHAQPNREPQPVDGFLELQAQLVHVVRVAGAHGVSRLRIARRTGAQRVVRDESVQRRSDHRRGVERGQGGGEALPGLRCHKVESPSYRLDQMPHGGIKESGNTREGPLYAVREMTEERLVILNGTS